MSSIRANVLLEAASRIHALREKEVDRGRDEGLMLAVKELKHMAAEAHDDYKKKKTEQRRAARASDAKWKSFGATR